MIYEIRFDSETVEFLEKAPKETAKKIWNKINSTKSKPHHFFKRLTGRKDYKLRVGYYRIIADIDDNKKIIEITLIDHRSKIYKNLK